MDVVVLLDGSQHVINDLEQNHVYLPAVHTPLAESKDVIDAHFNLYQGPYLQRNSDESSSVRIGKDRWHFEILPWTALGTGATVGLI